MKNIFAIFRSDIKNIVTHFFVLVVILGICVLPALYAWFNIYANWDPYANTGNVQLAAAIVDDGWTDDDGNYWNLGEEVREDLAASAAIHWVFTDSDEEVQEGVRSGKYYAAITLGEDFSKNMFSNFGGKTALPELKYYLNGKKNAVATKITDTAIENVQNSINAKYISIMSSRIFADLEDDQTASEVKTDMEDIVEVLKKVEGNLDSYDKMIDTFMQSNSQLAGVLKTTAGNLKTVGKDFDKGKSKISSDSQDIKDTQDSVNAFSTNVANLLSGIQGQLNTLADGINAAQLDEDVEEVKDLINELFPIITSVKENLDDLLDAVMALDPDEIPWEPVADELQDLQKLIEILETNATKTAAVNTAYALADTIHGSIQELADDIGQVIDMFSNNLLPSMNELVDNVQSSMHAMAVVLKNLSSTVKSLSKTLLKMEDTTNTLNESMPELQEILRETKGRISDLIEEVDNAAYSDQLQLIRAFLSGDPAVLGDYFADPVRIEDNDIYEIANYGSGVTPFYTALAIWVGVIILASVLKVHPKKEIVPNATRHERFFGRYLLFLLLSELQTAVIVVGELEIFKIQCLHPGKFILAAAIASLTISLIIYALVVSFGDIGKAISVIVLIIQIAGSGGTYPIEILPSFFQSIYKLFPFPYIIDAMRECIGGMYDGTYEKCLLSLGIFCAAALILGLLIRLPLISINKFVEKRMEDTKFM